jgi:hypothetical protein
MHLSGVNSLFELWFSYYSWWLLLLGWLQAVVVIEDSVDDCSIPLIIDLQELLLLPCAFAKESLVVCLCLVGVLLID